MTDTVSSLLKSLRLPATIDLSRGAALADFTLEAQFGKGSDIASVNFVLDRYIDTRYGTMRSFWIGGIVSDTFHDATPDSATTSISIDPATAPGTYAIVSLDIVDRAGNVAEYTGAQLAAAGFDTSFTITGSKADATPPRLLGLTMPASIDLSQGASTVEFGAKADDGAGAGVADVIVQFDKDFGSGYGIVILGSTYGDSFRDDTPGSATSSITFGTATLPGTYHIASVDVLDRAGNMVRYTPAQLRDMGIRTSLAVTDGIVPVEPGFALSPTVADGKAVLKMALPAWAPDAWNSASLVLRYDTTQAHFDAAALSGGAALVKASVDEAGTIGTVRISAIGMSSAQLQDIALTLDKTGGPGLVTYAIESLVVNDKPQALAHGGAGSVYLGGAGADKLAQADGIAFAEGGAGIDTVVYAGLRTDYVVHANDGGFTVDDRKGNVTILSHVERIVFADAGVAIDPDGNGGQVYRLYQAAFDRKPDIYGVGFWLHQMDDGMSLRDIAGAFITSREFVTLYGQEPDAGTFVDALYRNVLHRAPDQGGYDFWVNAVEHGYDRISTLVQFSESAENVATVVGSIEDGFAFRPW